MTTTTIDTSPLPVARAAAARLNMQEKALLISELAQELAQAAMPVVPTAISDPAALLAAVRERLASAPATRTLAEQLDADRRGRDDVLRGAEDARVHDRAAALADDRAGASRRAGDQGRRAAALPALRPVYRFTVSAMPCGPR